MRCTVVFLWDLLDREITDIHVGRQLWFERRTNSAKLFPDNASEERMLFDRAGTVVSATVLAQTVLCVAEEAR